MQHNTTRPQSPKRSPRQSMKLCQGAITIGMDLSDVPGEGEPSNSAF